MNEKGDKIRYFPQLCKQLSDNTLVYKPTGKTKMSSGGTKLYEYKLAEE